MSRKVINCPYCGKIISGDILTGRARKVDKCPVCSSQRNWKDGTRDTPLGKIQRYTCRDCGYRFSGKFNHQNS